MGCDPWADWNSVPVTNPVTTPWTSHFCLLSLHFLIRSVHVAINIPGNSPWHCHWDLLQIIIKISSSSKNLHFIEVALNYAWKKKRTKTMIFLIKSVQNERFAPLTIFRVDQECDCFNMSSIPSFLHKSLKGNCIEKGQTVCSIWSQLGIPVLKDTSR